MKSLLAFFSKINKFFQDMSEAFNYALDMFILRCRFREEERRLSNTTGYTGHVLLYLNVDKNGLYYHRFPNEVIFAVEKEIQKLGYVTLTEAGGTYLKFTPNFARVRKL